MMIKCRRTACTNEIDSIFGGGVHKHTLERYCVACARLINRENGEELITIPKFNVEAPSVQQIPKTKRCRGCGCYDGAHEANCRVVEQVAREKLQAECDHRQHHITQTTGDELGPPCCANCGLELTEESKP